MVALVRAKYAVLKSLKVVAKIRREQSHLEYSLAYIISKID